MIINIPGLVWERAQDSGMTQNPDESGYTPTLGHKLNAAPSRKVGKGYVYTVDLTDAEAEEFQEFCQDMLAPARDGEDHSELRALVKVIDRIEANLP